ncbi:hypothetical protein UPM260_1784 [Salmonella enterica subsp. enterica serovar Typhimurium]|nr:hypothetical protein UPM260_1784 [Salmonella enterica subsp. enterica serovar Typhimurium]
MTVHKDSVLLTAQNHGIHRDNEALKSYGAFSDLCFIKIALTAD